jgi:uncharacterized protein (TIGR03086 family)
MEHTDDITLLEGVLAKTGDVIDGVGDDQWDLPTPCPDYDVDALVSHIVGWVQVFASASNGTRFDGDPSTIERGESPGDDFRASSARLVAGWRDGGVDRDVPMLGGETPGAMVMNMTLMEYLGHGWDLAAATGQRVPFTDAEAEQVLARAEQTLPPQYRGPDQAFGDIVEVPADASGVERFVGFMGRDPSFRPAS